MIYKSNGFGQFIMSGCVYIPNETRKKDIIKNIYLLYTIANIAVFKEL